MYHAWFFFCLVCGQKFIKQLNNILHKEFDEILIHHEPITECPNCNQLCASTDYVGSQHAPMPYDEMEAPSVDDGDEGEEMGEL